MNGFESGVWVGVFAPAVTPLEVVQKVNREINRVLATAQITNGIREQGGGVLPLSPSAFAAMVKEELTIGQRLVTISGAKLD